MKILQVINSLNTGGAEKLILETIPLYQKKGLEIDVLLLCNKNSYFRYLLEVNNKCMVIGLTKFTIYNPFLIFKIIPYLKKYDIVHVHLFPSLYWVVLAKWLTISNIKIIYTEHSTYNRRRKIFLLKMFDRVIYKSLDKIITISYEVEKKLKKHLKLKDFNKYVTINNGISVSNFINAKPLKKDLFFSKDDILLIQVSSFREPKDQPTVIKALIFLPDKIKLLLVGDGPLKYQNEKLVEELQLSNRVKFLGIRKDIPELLQTSDIVILSSKYEGMSLSCIEGMAVKPFIASDVPGITDVVSGYGLLFNQGDSKELAEKILSLLNNATLFNDVASECTKRAKDYEINLMIEKHIKLYNSIIL